MPLGLTDTGSLKQGASILVFTLLLTGIGVVGMAKPREYAHNPQAEM
jgi:hypothetical protein